MKQKTDTSKIAKAVVDEIERRQVENEPLSPSASIWFILVVASAYTLLKSIIAIIIAIRLAHEKGFNTIDD